MSTLRDKTEAPIVVYPKPAAAPKKPWSLRRLVRYRAYQKRAKLCEALRSGLHRQSYGARDGRGGVCAMELGVKIGLYHSWGHGARRALKLDVWQHAHVMLMNDSQRQPFPEIAGYIESLP